MVKVLKLVKSKFFVFVMLLCAYILTNISGCMHNSKPQLEENSCEGYINWATSLSQTGYYDAAVRAAQTAVEMDPQNESGYITLAEIHLGYRDYAKAKDVYKSAVENLGENSVITAKINDIETIDLKNISKENSTAVSQKSEDSMKYDTTWKYNEHGSVVSLYFRTRDWTRSDELMTYEYDENNNLVRETVLGGYRLGMATGYVVYDYKDNVLVSKKETNYDGSMVQQEIFDAKGHVTEKTTYDYDGFHSTEYYDESGVLVRKEVYDNNHQELYHSVHEAIEGETLSENITYYNPDNTVRYTSLRVYGSSVKNIIKDIYCYPDGSLALYLLHKDNNHYYIYDVNPEVVTDSEEIAKYKFYDEAYLHVNELLGL